MSPLDTGKGLVTLGAMKIAIIAAALLSLTSVACSAEVGTADAPPVEAAPTPLASFGCEAYGGYAVSASFTAEERAAIEEGARGIDSVIQENSHPVVLFTGERAFCSFTRADEVKHGIGAVSDTAHQTSVVTFAKSMPVWGPRIARMAISQMRGLTVDRESCLDVGECEAPWAK